MKKSIIERFWDKVDVRGEEDCWEWQGAINSDGYGNIGSVNGKWWKAHRLSFQLTNGDIPKGMEVCHSCDNPKCCNPRHLWLGTHRQNTDDMTRKRRFAKKLSEEEVAEIRKQYAEGKTLEQVASVFGIGFQHVSRIVNCICWKNI